MDNLNVLKMNLSLRQRVKFAWQRITKGYCDSDLWDYTSFQIALAHNLLHEYMSKADCYPDRFANEEQWQEYITSILDLLKEADFDFSESDNPYTPKLNELSQLIDCHTEPTEDGMSRLVVDYATPDVERDYRDTLHKSKMWSDAKWEKCQKAYQKAMELLGKEFHQFEY